tara:strand:- start:284 stop:490 length:207 start_codon:yes stop_codon:yes gene_type:complete
MLDKNKSGKLITMAEKFKKRITKKGLICNKCKEDKPLDDYRKENNTWCIKCLNEYNKKIQKKRNASLW